MSLPGGPGLSRRSLLAATGLAALSGGTASAEIAGVTVIGRDGWLFPIWDRVGPVNAGELRQTLQILSETTGILKGAGINVVAAIIPSKARVYRQFMPADMPISADTDRRYATIISEFRKAGAIAPDLDAPFRAAAAAAAAAEKPLYFKTDTHWTPAAGELAAAEIAKAVTQARVLPASSQPGQQLGAPVAKTQARGDLVRSLPQPRQAAYTSERYELREPVAATGQAALLAGDAADVTIVGNSYTQPLYGFQGYVSNQLNRPVSLFWKPNNFGPYNILLSYLTSAEFRRQRPKMLIWEQLEWDFPALPNSSGWQQNAMPTEKFLGDLRRAVAG